MSDHKKTKKPKKSPPQKSKPKAQLAEVINIRPVDNEMVDLLQDLLDQAEDGRLTSLVACVTIDGEEQFILMGRPDQPAKMIGSLEVIKAELIDCVRAEYAEEG